MDDETYLREVAISLASDLLTDAPYQMGDLQIEKVGFAGHPGGLRHGGLSIQCDLGAGSNCPTIRFSGTGSGGHHERSIGVQADHRKATPPQVRRLQRAQPHYGKTQDGLCLSVHFCDPTAVRRLLRVGMRSGKKVGRIPERHATR